MAGPQENMVLRTIYLPQALDRRLREMAFSMEKPKGELMRDLVLEALAIRESQAQPLTSGTVAITKRSKIRVAETAAPAEEPVRADAELLPTG